MNVLVVGGAGFIGSHLVERLLAEGHTVDVVDLLSSGSLANLANARAAGGELKIHTLAAGAEEFQALVAMRNPDVIYHLAVLPPGVPAEQCAGDAMRSTLAVLEACISKSRRSVSTYEPNTKTDSCTKLSNGETCTDVIEEQDYSACDDDCDYDCSNSNR